MRTLSRFLLATVIVLTIVLLFRSTIERLHFPNLITSTQTVQAALPPLSIQPVPDNFNRLRLAGAERSPLPRVWLASEIIPRRTILSSLDTWGSPRQIIVRDNLAYVANTVDGLLILDLLDPRQPTILSSLNTPGQALNLLVRDRHLYVADGSGGVRIVDISTPATPREIARVRTRGPALALAEEEGLLYVACGKAGIVIIDVTAPAAPREVATIPLKEPAIELALQQHRLLVALSSAKAAAVVDTRLRKTEYLRLASGSVSSVAWQGTLAVVGYHTNQQDNRGAVAVFEVTADHPARLLTTLPLDSGPDEIRITGSLMSLALGTCGAAFYDISAPSSPRLVAKLELVGTIRSIAVQAEHLWLADSGGYILCSARELTTVRPSASPLLKISGNLTEKPLVNGRHLLWPSSAGLLIYDLRDPSRPAATLDEYTAIQKLERQDHLLFAASLKSPDCPETELVIFDVADTGHPLLLSQLTIPTFPETLAASRKILVVSARRADNQNLPDDHLKFYDISNPRTPLLASSRPVSTGSTINAMTIRDRYLYVQTSDQFMIFDIDNPYAPEPVGALPIPWLQCQFQERRKGDIVLRQQLAIVSSTFSGTRIYDVSRPRQPKLLGSIASDNILVDLAADNHYLYLLTVENGLLVFSIDNPRQPQFIGVIDTPFKCSYVTVANKRLWMGVRGLHYLISIMTPVQLPVLQHNNVLEFDVPSGWSENRPLFWVQQNDKIENVASPSSIVDVGR